MVSAARLEWIIQQLAAGRQASIRLLTYDDHMSVKVCLMPKYDPQMRNMLASGFLHSILLNIDGAIVVDHGHKKSNGESHICFKLRPKPDITQADRAAASFPDAVPLRLGGEHSDPHVMHTSYFGAHEEIDAPQFARFNAHEPAMAAVQDSLPVSLRGDWRAIPSDCWSVIHDRFAPAPIVDSAPSAASFVDRDTQRRLIRIMVESIDDRVSELHQRFGTAAVYMTLEDTFDVVRAFILEQCLQIDEIAVLDPDLRDALREQASRRIDVCITNFQWDVRISE